ncbi:hypothetical protein FTUN_3061 [Frigoriglobus tundricola]|uniref:Uncharacterized protein n=1 Tax=Frigoriglobus tundricola TaxID=2774151 RepID=A0A6M5YR90_9BACT|nr:hypothetical protein FTUN_3061 [Frigoriglobus tundricola]
MYPNGGAQKRTPPRRPDSHVGRVCARYGATESAGRMRLPFARGRISIKLHGSPAAGALR